MKRPQFLCSSRVQYLLSVFTFSAIFCSIFLCTTGISCQSWGRILGRNWYENLKSFPPCYSQSPLLTDFTPPPPKNGLKLVCNVNIVYGNLKSENSEDYAQKPQRNCVFTNSATGDGSGGESKRSHNCTCHFLRDVRFMDSTCRGTITLLVVLGPLRPCTVSTPAFLGS